MIAQANSITIPLKDESVQCVVTSPPYWGLRSYKGVEPTIWGGLAGCSHEWGHSQSLSLGRNDQDRDTRHTDGRNPDTQGLVGCPKQKGTSGQFCRLCNAWRGCLGLEPTVELFVEHLVAIFREIKRVLRTDGTCWMNLGSSYANSGTGKQGNGQRVGRRFTASGLPSKLGGALKPKDLVMIPHMVALALQQPYYTGKIRSEADRIWLAAMIDAEGCMFIHKRKVGQYASQYKGKRYYRKSASFGAGLEVANTHLSIIERCKAITGLGSICSQSPEQNKRRKTTIYRWNLRSNVCREVIKEVYPYLVGKQQQARILLGCPSSGPKAEASHEALKLLHNGGSTDIDFPAPASMYEPGWWVRSAIIWNKNNPMPESVTDRPTRSHEYVFLLTKAARYAYDAEAIKEVAAESTRERAYLGKCKESPKTQAMRANGMQGAGDTLAVYDRPTRNKRTVWTIPTRGYSGAHFATFPPALVTPCILAGTSARGACPVCGAGWRRVVEKIATGQTQKMADGWATHEGGHGSFHRDGREQGDGGKPVMRSQTTGWQPTCTHDAEPIGAIVLDPFAGSGTVGAVCRELGRRFIGLDLSGQYLRELALPRAEKKNTRAALLELPLFAERTDK